MKDTFGYNLKTTDHARKQMVQKGFDESLVNRTFEKPDKVYPSRSHPGQFRVTGNGICLVGKPDGNEFVLITIYEDQVLTPPRPDQLTTPEGRRYANRYQQGLGRG